MEAIRNLVPLLPVLLPFLGKVLLMIPVVPNKAIPFINALVASAAKYWYLVGFGQLGDPSTAPPPSAAPADTLAMAGVLGSFGAAFISVAWGCVDSLAAHYFYEGKRALAAKVGQQTWFEKGKRSIY